MATTIATDNDGSAPETFALQIVSPSVGFNGPVTFPELPTATTVQQLKAKIRERIQTKPHDDHQRLIHRGRLLAGSETMADVFGQETLRNAESQTLHLVLRPTAQQDPLPQTPIPPPPTTQQSNQTQPTPHTAFQPAPPSPTLPPAPIFPRFSHTGTYANQPQLNPAQRHTHSGPPTVYILSSPSGPRALLLTDTSTFYTPRPTPTIALPHIHPAHAPHQPGQLIPHLHQPHVHQAHHHHAAQHPHAHRPAQPDVPVVLGHQGNPAAAGALAVQLAPHLWLIVRLIGFIWFFTSGNTSWWRWSMITGLSVIFFLANTGLINWAPIRRHLENLIPLGMPAVNPGGAAGAGAQPAVAGAGAGTGAGARAGELDPQRVAERLIEQRRRVDAGWFVTQMRRVEHATLLFLASLWPGVGERHVAAREAEDAARRQREEAAEAARVAAQEAAQAAAAEGTEGDGAEAAGRSDRATDGGGSPERELPETQDEDSDSSDEEETQEQSSGLGGHERREQPLVDL